jgi:hypothetical protein
VRLTPPARREYCCWERTCGIGKAYVSSGSETYFYTGPGPDSYFEMDRIPKVLMSIQGDRLLRLRSTALACCLGKTFVGTSVTIITHKVTIFTQKVLQKGFQDQKFLVPVPFSFFAEEKFEIYFIFKNAIKWRRNSQKSLRIDQKKS